MPLIFSSVLAELNLIATLSLLNFASGYRVPLHIATGRGAFDNIRALVFGLYISSATGADYLSARGMSEIKEHTIAELMGVSGALHVERAHEEIPGVTVGELGGPVWEVVQMITRTLNETGAILLENSYRDLGSLLLEALKEGEKARGKTTETGTDMMCDIILERLVRVVPAFRDMAIVNEQPVYCFKKALLTIHAVALRFKSSGTSSAVPLPNTTDLPIFVDNVISSLLVHLGVIDLSTSTPSLGLANLFDRPSQPEILESLLAAAPVVPKPDSDSPKVKQVPKEGPTLTAEQAYILRGAAIDACELIKETAHRLGEGDEYPELTWLKEVTTPDLDAWIWAVAKDRPDYRQLERFVQRNTAFF